MRKNSTLDAGSEQCCANTGQERTCAKTNSNTNSGSISNLNNRPHDALRPMVKNNGIECSIPSPSTQTNANNHGTSNVNNRPNSIPLLNNNEIKYFLHRPSKESDKTSTKITKQLQREFKDVITGIGHFDGTFSLQVKLNSKQNLAPPW